MAGFIQEEAAREIGATISALTKWEHGVSVPRPE
jgi:transcriptional regulator with XRE-family HTH domain